MFKQRLATSNAPTPGLNGCPDIWELENGDVAVIGIRKTDLLRSKLPESAKCGPDEEIVIISRALLESTKTAK